MPTSYTFWSWLVFSLSASAHIPIGVGAWNHPIELNIASFSIWSILSCIATYSAVKLNMPGWKMMLGWVIGNTTLVLLGLVRGGYSFNLGPAETIAVYGIIMTLAAWAAYGGMTKKWNPRILFFGSMVADIISFYPQLKQYLMPHEQPTYWMLAGWLMWTAASAVNIVFVDKLFKNLNFATESKKRWLALEASTMSIENGILTVITIIVMYR